MFILFAAAVNTVLFRYSGQDDILLGVPVADRDMPELPPLIGFLLGTHVLRTKLEASCTFRELLLRVRQAVVDLYAHRAPPFDQVVAALQPERDLSHSPVFQVMLNWRDRDDQPHFIGFPGMVCESLLAHAQTSKFDLTIVLTDATERIFADLEYSTDLFDEARMERLIGHLHVLLEAAIDDADQRLAELPLLTAEERQRLLAEWTEDEEDEVYS